MAEITPFFHQLLLALQTAHVRRKQFVGKELAKTPEPPKEPRPIVARLLAETLRLHVQLVEEEGLKRTQVALGGLWTGEHGEEDERAEGQAVERGSELRVSDEEETYAVLRHAERCRGGAAVVIRYREIPRAREETFHHPLSMGGEEFVRQCLVRDARVVKVIEEDGEGRTRMKESQRAYDANNSGFSWNVHWWR